MAQFVDKDSLRIGVAPLTRGEAAWVKKLEKLLLACPTSRLHLVTIGDRALTVIDGDVVSAEDLDVHDGCAEENGVALAYVRARNNIHAVSG